MDKWSRMRLVVHICDNLTEAKDKRTRFKDCKTRYESIAYYEREIIALDLISKEASIDQDSDSSTPVIQSNQIHKNRRT